MGKSHQSSIWQIWIDTGGTFTDCLALDPVGQLHRAKVLSNSALRGFVEQQIDQQQIRIREKWGATDDLIRGFHFKILDKNPIDIVVEKYSSRTHILSLNKPLPFLIPPNTAFEVWSSEEAPVLSARLVTKTPAEQPLPNMFMRLASTRGTNALLERKGVPVALFITRGFTDLLRIGTQQRPELFALEIRKPEPLYEAVVSVKERIAADGSILEPLALQELAAEIEKLLKRGIRVAGIAFMHSYRNPRHERQLAKLLLDSGFQYVSCSAELAPFIKILPRAETAVVDAYLAPIMKDYLNRVLSSLSGGCLHVMTSAGGLVEARQFHAKDGLLSGPAGGVVGAAIAGRDSGFDKLIAFDMGGTSTDVARFDGEYEYVFEQQVGDAHLVAPALAIESVAAGGGSICSFDGYRLLVGPESASAQPGPACYGAGGPLTLTDVNLLLGRLDSNRFEIPISTQCAVSKLNELKKEISKHTGTVIQKETLLQGFLDIANERMADAIRRVSVRKGYAPQDYVLVAFGGAGGQHACGVARRLGIHKIIIPEDTSLLSAFGLGHAVLERFVEKQILQPLNKVDSKIPVWIDHLTEEAKKSVSHEGVPAKQIEVRRRIVHLRFVGQDSVLSVDYHPGIALQQAFETQYKEIFGHLPEGRQIEIESMRVVCSSMPAENCKQQVNFESYETNADGFTLTCFDNKWKKIAFYERSRLSPGAQLMGAALVFERHSTTVIEKGWKAEVDKAGALVLDCE